MWTLPFFAEAQDLDINLGKFNFFYLTPKIPEDGSITDAGLGLQYARRWGGELRFRNRKVAKNEELLGVSDSLNAMEENVLEVFFLPAKFSFIETPEAMLWAGGGVYYEYDKLEEKGFFDMPELEQSGLARVNSYTNEFSMHLAGPLIGFGGRYARNLFDVGWLNIGSLGFDIALSGGIAPVFFLASYQKTGIVPLLDPNHAEYDQATSGSPYFYLSLDMTLLRYINVVLLYDFARLRYRNIDFDEAMNWITPERTVLLQSFKIEASLLIPVPIGGGTQAQIGFGCSFDSTRIDDGTSVTDNRQYLILSVKKSSR